MNMHSNAAFDYELQRKKSDAPIKEIKKRKRVKTANVTRILLLTTLVVVSLSMLIYSRVQQSELVTEYDTAQKTLTEVKNQNNRLQIELEQKLSLGNVEQSAEQLGLTKMSDSQVQYINFNEQSKGEVVKEQNWFSDFSDWVKGLFE